MVEQIHLDISCTDCFKGVMCCSGNDNRRIIRTESGLKAENRRSFRSRNKRLENEAARQQFNAYLLQNYNVCASDLCNKWQSSQQKKFTYRELNRLLDLAEEYLASRFIKTTNV